MNSLNNYTSTYSIHKARALDIGISGYLRSLTLIDLEENSDFILTLSAVNVAGKSSPAFYRTTTIAAGEREKNL